MGAVITPQLVDVIDTFTGVQNYASGAARNLTECRVEPWGLRTECSTPEDPFSEAEVTWLLPNLNLRLTHYRSRSRHARTTPTMLTAVHIQRDNRNWHVTNLLLGLTIPTGAAARIARATEFAAAVGKHVLCSADAELALRVVHRTLGEISQQRHDLGAWLTYRGIYEIWPPL